MATAVNSFFYRSMRVLTLIIVWPTYISSWMATAATVTAIEVRGVSVLFSTALGMYS
jgi:hypothetical protein